MILPHEYTLETVARPVIVAVVGPTGSGKTALAIALAQCLNSEIVSADSMQFYRGMEIGTAAPSPEERAQAVHHFTGFLEPNEAMAAGEYARLARERVSALNAQGKIAVVVGGSGLYVSALIDGLFEGPAQHPEIRARLKAEAQALGNAALMDRLRAVDPAYAATLTSGNDLVRVVRALEVYEVTGAPLSQLHREHRQANPPLAALQLGLDWDRDTLYARIDARVDRMIAEGWLDEVRVLLERGHGEHLDRLKTLGYREIAACLRGEQTLDDTVAAVKQQHRRYAKRQLTWFRADKRVRWLYMTAETEVSALAADLVANMGT